MTYLQLVTALARKAAIPTTGLSDVTAVTTKDHINAVDWIKDAWTDIQNFKSGKWKFMLSEYTRETRDDSTLDAAAAVDNGDGTVNITITGHDFEGGDLVYLEGTTNYDGTWTAHANTTTDTLVITTTYVAETFAGTEVAGVRDFEFYTTDSVKSFDEDSFWYYLKTDGRSEARKLYYKEYRDFEDEFKDIDTPGEPSYITITPDKKLRVYPIPDDVYVLTAKAFNVPQTLAANTDTPTGLPDEFHMVIMWKALMDYGGFEEAGSVFQHANIRYEELFNQLTWQQIYEQEFMVVRPE